jgi:hypothetical protein
MMIAAMILPGSGRAHNVAVQKISIAGSRISSKGSGSTGSFDTRFHQRRAVALLWKFLEATHAVLRTGK